MVNLIKKLFVVVMLAIGIHNAGAMCQYQLVIPEEDLRVSQICGIMPNTKRSPLTGELDVFALVDQNISAQNAFRIQMFDKAYRVRNKYSRVCVPHDAECMFASHKFQDINVYIANLAPGFSQSGVYDPNDTVIGSIELLGLLTRVLDQTINHFQGANPKTATFLIDLMHTTHKETLCSCINYFAIDYGLDETDIRELMFVWVSQIEPHINEINKINLLLSQYHDEELSDDGIAKLTPSIISYAVLIERLNNSYPFGNPVRGSSTMQMAPQIEPFALQIIPNPDTLNDTSESVIPQISDDIVCIVYQMPIGQLAQRMKLSVHTVERIKDKTAVFVQRTDVFGTGTRYFSSPEIQILRIQLDESARRVSESVLVELSNFISNEEGSISEDAFVFISENFEEIDSVMEWANFQGYLRQRDIPSVFEQFGDIFTKEYREVKAMFSGLDVFG